MSPDNFNQLFSLFTLFLQKQSYIYLGLSDRLGTPVPPNILFIKLIYCDFFAISEW